MAENFRHGMPEELSGWLYKKQRVFPTKKKRYFKLASQVLSSHVRNVSYPHPIPLPHQAVTNYPPLSP